MKNAANLALRNTGHEGLLWVIEREFDKLLENPYASKDLVVEMSDEIQISIKLLVFAASR